jgi:predicted DNA binding protein
MTEAWRKPYHVVIEVENKHCEVLKKFVSLGLGPLKVNDIRGSKNGHVKHLVELDDEQSKKIPKGLTTAEYGNKAEKKPSMWFESQGCEVCNTILSKEAFLISGKSLEDDKVAYSFLVPTFEAYTAIITALENVGHKVTVLKMGSFKSKTGVLTRKQERLFWLALKGGFFDYPRKIGVRGLGSRLGISPATLSETMRRGTRRLLENYFEKEPS